MIACEPTFIELGTLSSFMNRLRNRSTSSRSTVPPLCQLELSCDISYPISDCGQHTVGGRDDVLEQLGGANGAPPTLHAVHSSIVGLVGLVHEGWWRWRFMGKGRDKKRWRDQGPEIDESRLVPSWEGAEERPKDKSDNAQPRTNPIGTIKRAPEAVHPPKTGHHRVTLQRQPNRLPRNRRFGLVDTSPSPSNFISKIRLRESAWSGLFIDTHFNPIPPMVVGYLPAPTL